MDWLVPTLTLVAAVAFLYYMLRPRPVYTDAELAKLFADAKAGRLPEVSLEDPKNGIIDCTSSGFVFYSGGKARAEVKWDDVTQIVAYKADLFSVDLICWGFCCGDDDSIVEVHEEMAGFEELQDRVQSRFGVEPEDWFDQVAFPAFAPNMTTIWPKNEGCDGDE